MWAGLRHHRAGCSPAGAPRTGAGRKRRRRGGPRTQGLPKVPAATAPSRRLGALRQPKEPRAGGLALVLRGSRRNALWLQCDGGTSRGSSTHHSDTHTNAAPEDPERWLTGPINVTDALSASAVFCADPHCLPGSTLQCPHTGQGQRRPGSRGIQGAPRWPRTGRARSRSECYPGRSDIPTRWLHVTVWSHLSWLRARGRSTFRALTLLPPQDTL